jgi:hypothetical protein
MIAVVARTSEAVDIQKYLPRPAFPEDSKPRMQIVFKIAIFAIVCGSALQISGKRLDIL